MRIQTTKIKMITATWRARRDPPRGGQSEIGAKSVNYHAAADVVRPEFVITQPKVGPEAPDLKIHFLKLPCLFEPLIMFIWGVRNVGP